MRMGHTPNINSDSTSVELENASFWMSRTLQHTRKERQMLLEIRSTHGRLRFLAEKFEKSRSAVVLCMSTSITEDTNILNKLMSNSNMSMSLVILFTAFILILLKGGWISV
eukprot:GHVR01179297.1.p1 GENE.GHVR01179297.1~~GHVR01179297.1.p1  ORF type:complete len:111 (+),score=18.47 GHVR01179297.1:263-595(+)